MATWTVQSSGGDYTSWSAAEAAQNGDHVTAAEITTIECYGMQDTTAVDINGGTANSSYYFETVAAAGAEAQMPANTDSTAYNLDTGGTGAQVNIQDDFVRIGHIQVEISTTTAATTVGFWITNTGVGDIQVYGCHCFGNSQSVAASFYAFINISVGNTNVYRNCFGGNLNTASGTRRGVCGYTNASGSTTLFYNCTSYGDMQLGFEERNTGDATTFKNCISIGARSNDFTASGTGTGHEYNVSGDTTAVGTNALTNQTTSIFADAAGGDYHLGAALAGVDLSADAGHSFSDDFDKDTRSAWDRGADEYTAAAGGRIMSSLAGRGGLAGHGGIAGQGGGLAG